MKLTIPAVASLTLGAAALTGWVSTAGAAAETSAAVVTATAAAETYTVDNVHSTVLFKVRHVGAANFYGRFNELSGEIGYEDGRIVSADITVPVASIDTNNKGRDDHLRNADFFNGRQYPAITFKSTSASADTITGELTLHGVTKTITADVLDVGTGSARGTRKAGAEFRFSIKRSDYGMRKYLADDLSDNGPIGNTVELIVAIEADG